MKHLSIRYSASAVITVTAEDLRLLKVCCKNHYDDACRSLAKYRDENGRPGRVAGMFNAVANCGESCDHELTWREIDTMAKALEVGQYLPNAEDAARCLILNIALRQVLNSLNQHAKDPVIL